MYTLTAEGTVSEPIDTNNGSDQQRVDQSPGSLVGASVHLIRYSVYGGNHCTRSDRVDDRLLGRYTGFVVGPPLAGELG